MLRKRPQTSGMDSQFSTYSVSYRAGSCLNYRVQAMSCSYLGSINIDFEGESRAGRAENIVSDLQ